jgi:hypothetical protein
VSDKERRFRSLGAVELSALIKGLQPQVAAAKRSARAKKETYRASQLVPLLAELEAELKVCWREMAIRDGIDPDAPAPKIEPPDAPELDLGPVEDLLLKFD